MVVVGESGLTVWGDRGGDGGLNCFAYGGRGRGDGGAGVAMGVLDCAMGGPEKDGRGGEEWGGVGIR